MVILITGASHVGKTAVSQRLMERLKMPYLSLDLLKMGLIRGGLTDLTPLDDSELQTFMWPVVKGMIQTALENKQNLIVEGGYVPFDCLNYFHGFKAEVRFFCISMTDEYIETHFNDIVAHANDVEHRISDDITKESVLDDNRDYRSLCEKHQVESLLISSEYNVEDIVDRIIETLGCGNL